MAASTILSHSLLLISRLIAYLFLGIMASKGVFLPPIVLFSLFVWHIWKCLSSVGNTYTELLVLTFEKCKEYEDENKQVIKMDKNGAPRIPQLSDLFQNVVDEILPFSKAYTRMCLQIALIWCFLLLTYYAIMTYSKTILDKYTETIAVALTGLIPHLFSMLQCGYSKVLKDKENEFIIKNIVHDFFDSSIAVIVKDVGVQTDMDSGHEGLHQSAARLLSNLSKSSSQEPQASHELEVHVDVNPNRPLYRLVSSRSTREEVDINDESSI